MKFFIQRVTEAGLKVDGKQISAIEKGFLVLIGIGKQDDRKTAELLVKKMLGLRIFEDAEGKTNLSLKDVGGSLLLVSQFTLYADCRKGNRPGFSEAAPPDMANELYEYVISLCREQGYSVQTGIFGADMKISLINDGPFTILLENDPEHGGIR